MIKEESEEYLMKVIMNADDFGFSRGVNLAILEGFQHGILTSTSLMVNMPGFEHAVSLMKQYPDLLHVGIHLVTTVQYSVVKGLKTLTDENDHFYRDPEIIEKSDQSELDKEYQAQMDKFLATGLKPDHIDFHVCTTPKQLKAAMKLAQKYHLPMRAQDQQIEGILKEHGIVYAPCHIPDFYDHGTVNTLLKLFEKALDEKREMIELALHPAYVDQTLLDLSSYHVQRAREFASLMNPEVATFIQQHDIELISFEDL
ncbi:ChbG/HpnK family deacetylase [Massilimicrobiota timonensis]|uniref:Carbohydrate deacetylase n=1 Tax=Massilimicrobiota timonensis TaxID=1776392 RepID=A0A1Y4SWF6_9FIRM|nr:ChbG/HpnK family deacetylase [Massilimicrobiota timonensis]OUQ34246.1 hypothetical protein B5E75_07140 [Massilimicrobiota timonensis]